MSNKLTINGKEYLFILNNGKFVLDCHCGAFVPTFLVVGEDGPLGEEAYREEKIAESCGGYHPTVEFYHPFFGYDKLGSSYHGKKFPCGSPLLSVLNDFALREMILNYTPRESESLREFLVQVCGELESQGVTILPEVKEAIAHPEKHGLTALWAETKNSAR